MSLKLDQLSAVGRNPDVAEKLDKLLTGPDDRAFLICESDDCKFHGKGSCSIYAVQGVPKMKTKGPCDSYLPHP